MVSLSFKILVPELRAVLIGALLALVAVCPAGAATSLPAAALELVGHLPEPPDGIAYLKLDTAFADFCAQVVPFGDLYRKVVDEQGGAFAARTGFHPIKDVQAVAVAVYYGPGASPEPMFFIEMAGKVDKFREALKKDGGPGHSAKFEGDDRGTLGPDTGFRFTSNGCIFGPVARIKKLKDGPPASGTEGWLAEAAKVVATEPRFFAVGAVKTAPPRTPVDGIAALFAGAKFVAVGLDATKFSVRSDLGSPQAASAVAGMANGMIQGGLPALQKTAEEATKNATSAFDLLSPNLIAAKATYQTGKQFADAVVLANDGPAATLTAERAKLPAFNPNVAMLGIAAAFAMPALRARQQAGFEGGLPIPAGGPGPGAPSAPAEAPAAMPPGGGPEKPSAKQGGKAEDKPAEVAPAGPAKDDKD